MIPDQTSLTHELNHKTIDAAVLAILLAELAPAVSKYPSAFESGEFLEEHAAFGPPNQQRIVLRQGLDTRSPRIKNYAYAAGIISPRDVVVVVVVVVVVIATLVSSMLPSKAQWVWIENCWFRGRRKAERG